MRAQRLVFRHASGRGPARPWWASPLFRVEDEGDDRNDARVAHARPIVAHNHGSWPCGQMLPRRRDRAGTRTWRSIGVTRRHCPIPPAAGPPPNLSANSEENRLSKRTKLHHTLALPSPHQLLPSPPPALTQPLHTSNYGPENEWVLLTPAQGPCAAVYVASFLGPPQRHAAVS